MVVNSLMDYLVPSINTSSHLELIGSLISAIKIVASNFYVKFRPSLVYNIAKAKNITYTDLRKSKTSQINYFDNKTVFKQVEQLVDFINESYQTAFQLIPNDLDIISYTTGDYFGKHTDFIPIKTPYMTYYTLILCLDAECQGGQTKLYFTDGTSKSFSETTTTNSWLIFKNSMEHEGLAVNFGHKIILKVNLVHLTLNLNPLYAESMTKLCDSRNQTIAQFKSKPSNILQTHSLSEYIFFRDCFKSDPNVVPFQFITFPNYNNFFDIYDLNDDLIDHSPVVWFNTGHHTPIIQWKGKISDSAEEDLLHTDPNYVKLDKVVNDISKQCSILRSILGVNEYGKSEDEDDMLGYDLIYRLRKYQTNINIPELENEEEFSLLDENEIKNIVKKYYVDTHDDFIKLKQQLMNLRENIIKNNINDTPVDKALIDLHDKMEINEIRRTITQMVYVFWTAAILGSDDGSETNLNFSTDDDDISQNIKSKIESNMKKIQKSETEIFSLDTLIGNHISYEKYVDIFTQDIIKKIADQFKMDTISYHVSGTYNCNEVSYLEYTCNAHFGFFNIKAVHTI